MSLDERLRQDLGRLAADLSTEPINIGADLNGVMVAGRRRRVLRKVYRGVAVATLLLLALFVVPSVLRSLGFLEITTNLPADNPPTESERNDGFGITGGSSGADEAAPRGGGVGEVNSASGGSSQSRSESGTAQRRVEGSTGVVSTKAPTPTPAGTYHYDTSGQTCARFQGYWSCQSLVEFEWTFNQPSGSHQRSTAKARYHRGAKFDAESGHDYRADGVYWEHYAVTNVNHWGAPGAWACPELEALPIRVWPTGAKPGDHFESAGSSCHEYYSSRDSEDRSTLDILRAETVSIGGRDVATFFVRLEHYRGARLYSAQERSVLPDHPTFFVKGYWWWDVDTDSGELWAELKSMNPS